MTTAYENWCDAFDTMVWAQLDGDPGDPATYLPGIRAAVQASGQADITEAHIAHAANICRTWKPHGWREWRGNFYFGTPVQVETALRLYSEALEA